MTVALARDVEDFLQDQVRAGVCADASELVNDVIRSLREQQRKLFDLTPELKDGCSKRRTNPRRR